MRASICTLLLALCAVGCGGGQEGPPAEVKKQTAADEVLRLGNVWTNIRPDKGILSPPSKISLFRTHRKSELRLSENRIIEKLTIDEEIQLRNGSTIKCATEFEHELGHRWGRKNGEPALELVRPALNAPRRCNGPHPDGAFAEPAKRALFVLRSDSLVAIEPVVDQRVYMPGQL